MDWIWKNIELIVVVAGSIAVWLNQRRREKSGEPADYDGDGVPDNHAPQAQPRAEMRELAPLSRDGTDPVQAERVRRIQEEIRRKIAERRGQAAPPPMPAPTLEPFNPLRPVFREEPVAPARRQAPPPIPVPREEPNAYDDSAALERQRRLAEQLAELESRRRETRHRAQALAETGAVPVSAREKSRSSALGEPELGMRGLVAELRDPKALRRAMVLREVLDAPVALR